MRVGGREGGRGSMEYRRKLGMPPLPADLGDHPHRSRETNIKSETGGKNIVAMGGWMGHAWMR